MPQQLSRTDNGQRHYYEICVEGLLDEQWGERLNGMQITHDKQMTILRGAVTDQAALIGILNTLYNLQCPLVYVRRGVYHSPAL